MKLTKKIMYLKQLFETLLQTPNEKEKIANEKLSENKKIKFNTKIEENNINPKLSNKNTDNTEFKKQEIKKANKPYDSEKIEKKSFVKDVENCYSLFAKDGDTFEAMYKNKRVTFKLAGLDAPDKGEQFSKNAKFFLNNNIKARVVYIKIKGEDELGRPIVDLFLDKQKKECINDMLLQNGLAVAEVHKNKNGFNTCTSDERIVDKQLEQEAQNEQLGQWQNKKLKFPKN